MMLSVFQKVVDGAVCRELHDFMETEGADTDCIEDEMEIYEEDRECNLSTVLKHQMAAFEAMRRFIRKYRVCKKAFSVGKPLFYWKWHQNVKDEDIKKNADFQNIKWDGHSIKELLVSPHYDSIKEEAVQSGLITAAKFEKNVVQKAERYLKGKKCRKMKSDGDNEEYYHFGVEEGSPLSAKHPHSLFLYTFFSDFCSK